jgi:acetyl/propionyl-CoA carboxylase alpha subunit
VRFAAELGQEMLALEVTGAEGRYRVILDGQGHDVDARQVAEGIWSLLLDGVSHTVDVTDEDGVLVVAVDGERYRIRVEEETRYIIRTRGGRAGAGGQVLRAPLPGKVAVVEVTVGQAVQPGDGLVVIEAMKMENEFRAAVAGVVKEVRVTAGQAVNAGDTLLVIE